MKFLFSGATNYKVEQPDINKSLGGFMSSTSVPNKKLNALFSDLSNFDLKNKSQNTIGIFMFNDTTIPINNISLETIYQNKFGKLINLCDFEFSISEVSSSGSIEVIGSVFEEPFYANWFDCESAYEFCNLKLKTAGQLGDDLSLFGLVGTLTGNTIESLQKDIFDLINSSSNLVCEIVDEMNVFIRSKEITLTNENSNFLTSGNAEIEEDVMLQNGKDGRTLIYDSLLPDKAIGIWIKRKINNNYKLLNSDCQDLKLSNLEKIETLEMVFHHD
jgi:hypothetical protein